MTTLDCRPDGARQFRSPRRADERAGMGIVIEARLHDRGRVLLEDYLAQAHVLVIATDDEQVRLALDARRRYGRGRHVAALNLGNGFSHTDLAD